ncbi:MAG: PAS domain S-box protein, partial [Planctomycetota bacterium]
MAVRTKRGAGTGKKADRRVLPGSGSVGKPVQGARSRRKEPEIRNEEEGRANPGGRDGDLRFQVLVDSGQALIWASGPDKKCDYFNLPWLRFRGRTLEQELGDGWIEGIHPDDLKSFIGRYQSAFDRRECFSTEFRLRRCDGEFRWIQDDGTPRVDGQGNFRGYIGHCLDVTDRKRAEEKNESLLVAVQNEKTILLTLINSITDEVWFADSEGRFTLANPAALKEFALDPDRLVDVETLAKSLEVFRPDGSPRPAEEAPPLRALSGEVIRNQEEIIRTPSTAELRHRQVSAAPVRDPEGRIIGAVSVVCDITDIKRAEVNLRALSRRQEAIITAVVDIIMEVNTEKVYTWANPAGLEFFGGDVIGKKAADFFVGEQETYIIVKPLFNGKEDVFYVESWQRRKDGEKRLLAWWCHVLKDAEGNVTGALSTARDITERVRAEAKLQESKALYESIFEATGTATLLVEEDTTIVMANRECLPVTGYRPEELVGTRWPSYVAPESLEIMLKHHGLRREGRGRAPDKYEVRLVNKKGQARHVILNITMIPGTKRSVVSMLDVTERKEAEEALRQSEDKYRTLIENAGEAIFVV